MVNYWLTGLVQMNFVWTSSKFLLLGFLLKFQKEELNISPSF